MYNVNDFIVWALTHAKKSSIPPKARLPLQADECGNEPWHYLFGTVKSRTTPEKLEERWENYYRLHGFTRDRYDKATRGWKDTEYATDCQGLLDAWLTELGEKTDINADMNYKQWCENKGKIQDISRPYIIGEALFIMRSSTGKMIHVGWVCGFDEDDKPLIIEARSLEYGIMVTRFSERPWTHRGLMINKISYESEENTMDNTTESTIFEVTSPMHTGEAYKAMQIALNAAGYTDEDGKKLETDGKWGNKSQHAFDSMTRKHAVKVPDTREPVVEYSTVSSDGKYKIRTTVAKIK